MESIRSSPEVIEMIEPPRIQRLSSVLGNKKITLVNMSSGPTAEAHVSFKEPEKEVTTTIAVKSPRSRSAARRRPSAAAPPVLELNAQQELPSSTSQLRSKEQRESSFEETHAEPVKPVINLPEPILTENPFRHTIFPLQYPKLFAKYKNHLAVFWTPEEIDLSKDMAHWAKLNKDEQHFIKHILGFFAGSDGIVMENLSDRFAKDVQIPEARFFYAAQNVMESIHSETYSLLIDTYIDDPQEKLDILRAVNTIPCVKKKAEWAQQWITSADDFATRLLAFATVEGIFFSGAFCAIYWIKERGIMPGLTFSNELIARDEGLHTDFAVELYKELKNKLSKEKVHKIIREAVKAEKEFITKALPCDMIGMNSKMMSQYIEFVADRLTSQLGYPKIWYSKNPFDFMERISLESKENFFEKRVSTYAKATVGRDREEMKFSLDADF
jgi:ribonucleotide reductase beta subunit family protein with ferritin-like domain